MKMTAIVVSVFLLASCASAKPKIKTLDHETDQKPAAKSVYDSEREEAMAKLLQAPPTPLRVPPTVLRIHILPYVDRGGGFNGDKYKFITEDEGRWILDNQVLSKRRPEIKELKPLESAKPARLGK
ncbi:TraV family lipoprotein [Candidatus Manganitrophus noduliformans]|uniref:TraV family lipoprotein n=1 Tax=Candidatus Manganitrophus noduliformans TaxID=2606439 RepID=A0A7X6IDC7_9BACT|nr:TraV family lipoprotein [Candidatus Manganitrophus noduliformans]NKE73461.1 TraV family lipoprotein [Candidatus Manganitrophus noduliformans]